MLTPAHRQRSRWLAGLLLSALLTTTLWLAPRTAGATDNGAWSIAPATADDTISPRSSFLMTGSPGQTLTDTATVENLTDQPITFRLYAADAFTTEGTGAFSLRTADQPKVDLGSWIALPPDVASVTVEGGGSLDIPFSIAIPANASPGDHAAGIVALNLTPVAATDSSVGVEILRAVGVRTYLRVSGPTTTDLDVSVSMDTKPPALPLVGKGSATITYEVRNSGNLRVTPEAILRVHGFLDGSRKLPRDLPELLPGSEVTVTERVSDLRLLGRLTADVEVTADDVVERGSIRRTHIPWLLLVIVLGVVAAAVALLRRRRRQRAATTATSLSGWAQEPA